MDRVNLIEKGKLFSEAWSPKIIGELNGQHVKLARFDGEFGWHSHRDEDEMFLVVEGEISIALRDRSVQLKPGEFFIVPRGVQHNPSSPNKALVMLFEPAGTLNTGDTVNEKTKRVLDRI